MHHSPREVCMTRRPLDARSAAEKAFKAATTKPVEGPPKAAPSIPGAKETVSLRIDRDVLDFFQEGGPGWQDRINAALRKAAGKGSREIIAQNNRVRWRAVKRFACPYAKPPKGRTTMRLSSKFRAAFMALIVTLAGAALPSAAHAD